MRTVIATRSTTILALGVFASLVGSRGAEAAPPSCDQYPIAFRPSSTAQAAAQAELSGLSPGARLTWNDNTGTLSSVFQLAFPLLGCTAGRDVGAQVFEVLAAHPTLFQLDLSEWRAPPPFDCKFLGNFEILNTARLRLAGRPIGVDFLAYSLRRINGVVHLDAVIGTYLPIFGAAMSDMMSACTTLTEAAAVATLRKTPLPATVFSQCSPIGAITYTPRTNDLVSSRPGDVWTWHEDVGQSLLSGQRTLRVVVATANHTPELLASDARCPVGNTGEDFTIGFDIVFDVHTGEVVSVKPGLGCVVC
jgi:hypothetical protein